MQLDDNKSALHQHFSIYADTGIKNKAGYNTKTLKGY